MTPKQENELSIFAFIKAVDKQYCDNFINYGEICLQTTKWFRGYEKQDQNIGDSHEGSSLSCAKGFTVQFGPPISSSSSKEDLETQIKK